VWGSQLSGLTAERRRLAAGKTEFEPAALPPLQRGGAKGFPASFFIRMGVKKPQGSIGGPILGVMKIRPLFSCY